MADAGGAVGQVAGPGLPAAAADLHRVVLDWFAEHARDLPWRHASAGAWGVLVSEVMLQQTPVARVEPVWREWMARWPRAADLAAAPVADVLRAWGRLGYPRRALRLREAATAVVARHGGEVPRAIDDLRALPGVGDYTAGAVHAFAFRGRAVVLDTNVRRVLARVLDGKALPPPTLRRAESERAAAFLPAAPEVSARWNAAVMELGALVCTARSPACHACPLAPRCRWLGAGRPADQHAHRRRTQAWHGTDRQARGRVLGALRDRGDGLLPEELADLCASGEQCARVVAGLLADGLLQAEADLDGVVLSYHLPRG